MKRASATDGPGVIELVEEAVHLLRGAPVSLLALYAVGTLPFVLAFLYFWATMSRGAFAREHAASDALGLALVFLWMKCWQAAFACELRARVTGQSPTPWTVKRAARLALVQTALQPIGLFVVPVASLIVLPAGWAYGFFQNITVIGDGSLNISETSKISAAQASVRPGQSYLALAILSIFAFFVWLNVAIFVAMLPGLLKTFLGFDNAYTRAGMSNILNTTYLACTVAVTYVCVDPLAKAVYVLRCFYGQSMRTAEDLKAELARVRAQALAILVMMFCLANSASAASADNTVSPSQLNQSINEVQKEAQFAWRMPREERQESDDANRSWIVRMLRSGAETVVDGLKWVGRSLKESARWIWRQIQKLWPEDEPTVVSSGGSNFSWAHFLQVLLLILIAAIAAFLGVLIYRLLQRRSRRPVIATEIMQTKPDLNDENVAANQLPEEGWLRMARELMAQGNLRLALRALYLAGLAHLAARELISVAIFKSNREYEAELRRRARADAGTLGAFSEHVAVFDRVWYGLHNVTTETLQEFEANLDRIRAC
jgi:Domain of unknown function (DUF4129)